MIEQQSASIVQQHSNYSLAHQQSLSIVIDSNNDCVRKESFNRSTFNYQSIGNDHDLNDNNNDIDDVSGTFSIKNSFKEQLPALLNCSDNNDNNNNGDNKIMYVLNFSVFLIFI